MGHETNPFETRPQSHVLLDRSLPTLVIGLSHAYMQTMTDPLNLIAARTAPTLADLEDLAARGFASLPQTFQALCEGLVIRVEDFPDEETLDDMDCETEYDLLGLFHGRGLPHRGAGPETGELPNMIWLYRRPILDFWCDQDETLGAVVTHVLVHEIGHHFGLSDADMDAIETAAG